MKKIALSLLALTALSGAALANDRAEDSSFARQSMAVTSTSNAVGATVIEPASATTSSILLDKRFGTEKNTGGRD